MAAPTRFLPPRCRHFGSTVNRPERRTPIGRMGGLVAFVGLTLVVASSYLSAQSQTPAAQSQPRAQLGVLAPANIAKPRAKPPFNITGTWLHAGESERFDPSEGFKLTNEKVYIPTTLVTLELSPSRVAVRTGSVRPRPQADDDSCSSRKP
jgi:hypothetical protein